MSWPIRDIQVIAKVFLKMVGGTKKFRWVGARCAFRCKRWKNVTNIHTQKAVNKWKEDGLQAATIKEYLSGVRTVCRIYGNDRIKPDNTQFGIPNRVFVENRDKSIPQDVFQKAVTELKQSNNSDDKRVASQLQLERYIGLRVEEACNFNAHQAVMTGGRVFIQHGTKGGRERIINELTEKGKAAIEYAKALSGINNLIITGKPPALPGDSQSLTIPGIDEILPP